MSVKTKRIKQQHLVHIASQNTRGQKSDHKLQELITTVKRKRKQLFDVCLQEAWRTGLSTTEHDGYLFLNSGLQPNLVKSRRGEQGVGIILSPTATVAWRSAGSVLHNTFGGRVIAVRLLVKDDRQQEIGLYLVSAYAPVPSWRSRPKLLGRVY